MRWGWLGRFREKELQLTAKLFSGYELDDLIMLNSAAMFRLYKPNNLWSVSLLPPPEGPTIETNSPFVIEMLTSFSATTLTTLELKTLVRLMVCSTILSVDLCCKAEPINDIGSTNSVRFISLM